MELTTTVIRSGLCLLALSGGLGASAFAANEAVVDAFDLPAALAPGESYEASVTMRNVGTTTWRNGDGYLYSLGAVGDYDPFAATTRVPLDPGEEVEPQGRRTFYFTLTGRAGCRELQLPTRWQMVQDLPVAEAQWFGGTAEQAVAVVDDCAYRCNAHVADGYRRPIGGVTVTLTTFIRSGDGLAELDRRTAVTNAQGNIPTLRITPGIPAQVVRCEASDLPRVALNTVLEAASDEGLDPTSTTFPLDLRPLVAPAHTGQAVSLPGLKTGGSHGSGEAKLYLSGDGVYDKVVVIPQGFDFAEQIPGARKTADTLWIQFRQVLVPLRQKGYDVWLVRPFKTGQNIHEQAAELAQAIRHAATYNGGPPSGRVIVAGYSLGGIVARVATARWQGDPAWRAQLQLPQTLPVSLVAFGDAPLRGAQAPVDFIRFMWDKEREGQFNLNTCAAQALLRRSCVSKWECPDTNHRTFYETGGESYFQNVPGAVCDSVNGPVCECDAGPAVYEINGDGFAHVPTVAFSAGTWDPDWNMCHGGDEDRNADFRDLCPRDPGGSGAFAPQTGDIFANLRSHNCPFGDEAFAADPPDLEAGSRLPVAFEGTSGASGLPLWQDLIAAILGGICTGGRYSLEQNFAPTFIPIRSALAADGRGSVPFGSGNWKEGSYQASHDRPEPWLIEWLIERFDQATANQLPSAAASIQPTATPREYRFDGSASSDADGTIVSYAWEFGDGAQASGQQLTHRYAAPGHYGVRLTVTDNRGGVGLWMGNVNVPEDTLGYLDSVDPVRVAGWACNRNDFGAALAVQVYLDGPAGLGRLAGTAVANIPREPAVGAQCGGNSNHGYQVTFPASIRDGQTHSVYAYATYAGASTHLSGSPSTVTFPRPIGYLDSVDGVRAVGWACDSDDYNATLAVHFYMDGPAGGGGRFVGTASANVTREAAVGNFCGGNNNHGYQFTFPAEVRDGQSHSVYAYAIDYLGVYNTLLTGSPRTAVFPLPTYALTLSSTGTGTGTIIVDSLQPPILCSAACSVMLTAGTQVRLITAADTGFTFAGWAGACQGMQSSCDLTMSGPKQVTAAFQPPAYSAPLQFYPLTQPCRIVDSRLSGGALPHGGLRAVQVSGSCVPAGAQAVAATITAVSPTAGGHMRMNGNPLTLASVCNFPTGGGAWASSVVSSLSEAGQATVSAALRDGGSTHFVIDVSGYFAPPGPAGQNYTPRDTTRRLVDANLTAGVASIFVSGAAAIAPATPSALAVSVAAIAPPAAGHLVLYPAGSGSGGTSSLNYSAGSLLYNGGVVGLGSVPGGDFAIRSLQSHRVIVDVNGVFHAPVSGSLQYHRIEPCRVLDTRVSGPPLAAGESRPFQVRRMCGAIPDTARAVAANFAVVEPAAAGHLAFGPTGGPFPTGAHLLYQATWTIGSGALLPLSASVTGVADLTVSSTAATHVVADVTGYFSPVP